MLPHITHLLQLFDVCVFQPLKHLPSEAINEVVQNGDKNFSKLEFLNIFNTFRNKAFKEFTIRSIQKKTGLILYNHALVIDKVWKRLSSTCGITPRSLLPDWLLLDKTPTNIKDMRKFMFNQLANTLISQEFCETWTKFAKSVCQVAQKADFENQVK